MKKDVDVWRGAGERHTLVDQNDNTVVQQPSGEPVVPKKPSRWKRFGNAVLGFIAPFLAGGAGRPGR